MDSSSEAEMNPLGFTYGCHSTRAVLLAELGRPPVASICAGTVKAKLLLYRGTEFVDL
jgi:hypothetical protein